MIKEVATAILLCSAGAASLRAEVKEPPGDNVGAVFSKSGDRAFVAGLCSAGSVHVVTAGKTPGFAVRALPKLLTKFAPYAIARLADGTFALTDGQHVVVWDDERNAVLQAVAVDELKNAGVLKPEGVSILDLSSESIETEGSAQERAAQEPCSIAAHPAQMRLLVVHGGAESPGLEDWDLKTNRVRSINTRNSHGVMQPFWSGERLIFFRSTPELDSWLWAGLLPGKDSDEVHLHANGIANLELPSFDGSYVRGGKLHHWTAAGGTLFATAGQEWSLWLIKMPLPKPPPAASFGQLGEENRPPVWYRAGGAALAKAELACREELEDFSLALAASLDGSRLLHVGADVVRDGGSPYSYTFRLIDRATGKAAIVKTLRSDSQ